MAKKHKKILFYKSPPRMETQRAECVVLSSRYFVCNFNGETDQFGVLISTSKNLEQWSLDLQSSSL